MEILKNLGDVLKKPFGRRSKNETFANTPLQEDKEAVSDLISQVARDSLRKGTPEGIAFALFLMDKEAEGGRSKSKK